MHKNNNKYFDSFSNICKVDGAKSLSYQYELKNGQFDFKLLKEFKKVIKIENTFRLLLHPSPQSDLHDMVIAMKNNTCVLPHKHHKSESYHIMDGEMLLVYFSDDGQINNFVKLSHQDTFVARVDSDQYHGVIALSEYIIFHETRIGPFHRNSDSVFATWADSDTTAYIQRVLHAYKGIQ